MRYIYLFLAVYCTAMSTDFVTTSLGAQIRIAVALEKIAAVANHQTTHE